MTEKGTTRGAHAGKPGRGGAKQSAARLAAVQALYQAELTDAPAELDPEPGGEFSCFGGMIVGRTIENIPGQRLVQAWRVANWAVSKRPSCSA